MTDIERLQLAEAVRAECVRVALAAYDMASTDGLCDEGAFEVAIDALRGLDLHALLVSQRGNLPSARRA
jgi:hypothetical protein